MCCVVCCFFLNVLRPPVFTRTDNLSPNTKMCRSESCWTDSSRTAFGGVWAYRALADQPFTIGAIYRLRTTGDTRGFFRRVLEDRSLDLSQGCRNALADFTSGADNTFAGIVQTVTSKLSLWLNPRVDAATEECDFDLRELRTKRMSIYLGVSPDELDRVAPPIGR